MNIKKITATLLVNVAFFVLCVVLFNEDKDGHISAYFVGKNIGIIVFSLFSIGLCTKRIFELARGWDVVKVLYQDALQLFSEGAYENEPERFEKLRDCFFERRSEILLSTAFYSILNSFSLYFFFSSIF